EGIRKLRSLYLAIRFGAFSEAAPAIFGAGARANPRIRRDEQGSTKSRFPFCRPDDLLRIHAGCRHGQRSRGRLFSPQENSLNSVCDLPGFPQLVCFCRPLSSPPAAARAVSERLFRTGGTAEGRFWAQDRVPRTSNSRSFAGFFSRQAQS